MPWEVFGRAKVASSDEPTIGVQPSGRLSLNAAAYTALGAPKAVELLHDPESGRIALRPAEAGAPTSYPVRQQRGREQRATSSYVVTAATFLAYAGIKPGESTVRYRGRVEEDVLVVDLQRDCIGVSHRRGRRSEHDGNAR